MANSESLVFLGRSRVTRERPVMLITDCPIKQEIKDRSPFSSQSIIAQFSELNKVGVLREYIHPSYIVTCRPEDGDLQAVFHHKSLPFDGYQHWPQSKKDYILSFAFTELETLKKEIHTVKPAIIICTSKWALYFLTGETTFAETKKSQFGSLVKWRTSHLQLGSFWNYNIPHIVFPILPASSIWQMPEKENIIRADNLKLGRLFSAYKQNGIAPYISRIENFIIPKDKSHFPFIQNCLFELLLSLEQGPRKIVFDVETRDTYIDCLGLATSPEDAICIPFSSMSQVHFWDESQEVELIGLLYTIMKHPNCLHRGQNYLYDMQYYFWNIMLTVKCYQDSMIMHHILFPGMEKSLAFLASMYCTVYRYWKEEGKTSKGKSDMDRWRYNCKDTTLTYEVCDQLEMNHAQLPEHIRKAYEFQQYKLQPALLKMMKRGARIDRKTKSELYIALKELVSKMDETIKYIFQEDINFGSGPQMLKIFYELFALPEQRNKESGKLTLDANTIHTLIEIGNPLARPFLKLLLEYREISKFASSFLGARTCEDGRMRCSYNPCGTDTFRLSSSKDCFGLGLNQQTIPVGKTTINGFKLPNVRSLYLPDPGKVLFDIDLDSADLRIVVAEAGAKDLQHMLDEGKKPYVEMMKEYYNDPTKSKHSPEYKIFKSFAHGTNYLGSAKGLAGRLGLLVHEVDKLQKWYFGRNPEIKKWHEELRKQVDKRGWIENVWGYRRYFFNKKEVTLYQIAAAWKPQSSVGILINKGWINIEEQEPEINLILQVHDSLVGQFPQEKPEYKERIVELCSVPLPYSTPIIIPVGIVVSAENWGKCKD